MELIIAGLEMKILFSLLAFSFFIYWCINEKIGLQICLTILISIWVVLNYRQLNIQWNKWPGFSWVFIAIVFVGYILSRDKLESLLLKGGFRIYMVSTAVISFLMILYRPDFVIVIPAGFFLGMGLGYNLNKKYVGFKSACILQKKKLTMYLILFSRFVTGILVLVLIFFRVEKIINNIPENQNIFLYTFLCAAFMGFWVSIAAPWLFEKLRLTSSPTGNQNTGQK
ncbi:MAG: hypothetical protein FWD14_01360 [Treponema sp.]|nr:hypothetical protein [Treponema sp.]